MADKKVDVGVRLKLEQTDAAANEIEKLRKRVLELEGATKEADHSFLDLAKQAAAVALGVELGPAIHEVADFAKELVMTSVQGDAADTALASLITTVQGIPWDESKKEAGEFGDYLDEVSASAGVMGDDLAAALQVMVEMKGASEEGLQAAHNSVNQLAMVSGLLGKSVEATSREFSLMSEGMLRTKGQMFQLLQTTGIFGDNVKKAAAHWSMITEESRIELLEYGLSKVAGSMAKAEPSAKQLLTSIDSLYDTAKERLGDSMLHELVPVLTEVKNRMSAAIPAIEKVAHEIGPEVAKWIGDAVRKVEDGFRYLRDHSREIHDAIVSAYEKAKNVVDFIIANKDAIALAFGAKTAVPAIGGVVTGVKAATSGASAVAGAVGLAGAAGTAAVMVTFAAAVAAFAAAAYFLGKHIQDEKARTDAQVARLQEMREVAETGDVARVQEMSQALREMAMEGDHKLTPALRAAIEHMNGLAEAESRLKDNDLSMVKSEIDMALNKAKEIPAMAQMISEHIGKPEAQEYTQNAVANQAALLIDAYNEATRLGSTAMASLAAQTLAGSKDLQKAFLNSSLTVNDGMEKFADVLLAGGSQFAGFAAAIRRKESAKVPGAPVVHMSGGQTFKITQDFKSEDPDRIALIFERDIVKLAENRIQARTTIPFGG